MAPILQRATGGCFPRPQWLGEIPEGGLHGRLERAAPPWHVSGVDAEPLEASPTLGRSVGMMPPAGIFAVPWIGKLPLFQAWQLAAKVLEGRFARLHTQWAATRAKLLEYGLLRGLNFEPWPRDGPGRYSVRVDDNFRAHRQHLGDGRWIAYVPGLHTQLGHG